MACDLCGKTGTPLNDLLDTYKTDEIASICYDCEKAVNKQKSRLQTWAFRLLAVFLKRWMAERRQSMTKASQGDAPQAGERTC